ncbi:MAG: hypothetical protein JNM84_00140 [Planctomycetes bacterium]|nr:hypothetical protein [Planctomycetota bacterium]
MQLTTFAWRLASLLVIALPLSAQIQWSKREILERTVGPVAYDSARDRLVLLSSPDAIFTSETWEFDGNAWTRRDPALSPSPRTGHGLVYDALRQRTVLFGSASGANDTWEWDGVNWTQRTPANSPPFRRGFGLAYDPVRGRTVLFGGLTNVLKSVTYLSDTWEWDGANWTQINTPTRPPGRGYGALGWDGVRQRILLFGGDDATWFGGGGPRNDTWEFDGSTWSQHLPATSPTPRISQALAFDSARGRALLFGGLAGGNALADAWEWDGTNWSAVSPTGVPARFSAALAYDTRRSRLLLFSGSSTTTYETFGDLWQSTGTWSRIHGALAPGPRHSASVVYDSNRGRLIVHGGSGTGTYDDLWELDGVSWNEIARAVRPSARARAAMVFDTRRNRAVLFGGELPGPSNETWEWTGTTWIRALTSRSPLARFDHAMAYDEARGTTVLFGGIGTSVLGDTWTFDGVNWTQRTTPVAPSVRANHALAFDAHRGEVVLFGGGGQGGQLLSDTWVWNGAAWIQRQPAVSPPARAEHALTYDPLRRRVVLFGGGYANLDDTWDWDGVNWQQRSATALPTARQRHGLAFDTRARKLVLFSGQTFSPNLSDTWDLGPTTPAESESYGAGCSGSAGTPILSSSGSPWLGDALVFSIAPTPQLAPSMLWLGISSTLWNGIALPLDLSPFGSSGCSLFASIDAELHANSSGTTASASALVPVNTAFLGATVYAQSLVIDASANPLGAVFSNALRLRLGSR